jgi:16S rRNA G966 N2-methylase RsmD
MLPTYLLHEDIQAFISNHIGLEMSELALRKNPFPTVSYAAIINQIVAKTKAKEKLSTWFNTENIIYPSKISIEQTSSEKTATYKAKIVSGEKLIDVTGGFGVDDYYFSKKINTVYHCELNQELSAIVNHNFEVLQQKNIHCISGDSYDILQNLKQQFDWIYIDPSRRNETKGKVFMLADCLPNVSANLNFYFLYSNKILLKTAPILDITAGISELTNIKCIHIVAVNNEVKELLWELEKNYSKSTRIKTINFTKEIEEVFEFDLSEKSSRQEYALPKKYIYEPNAAILKSGAFELIPKYFNLFKLHQHSHLYTAEERIEFTGRVFIIESSFEYNKASMKKFLQHTKANITARNFPESVAIIRKKWNIKDGGNVYSFFTTDANNRKIVLICAKI